MDAETCRETLVGRCVALLLHYHGPIAYQGARRAIAFELKWLAFDADLWGVDRASVIDRVLEQLVATHDRRQLVALQHVLFESFGEHRASAKVAG